MTGSVDVDPLRLPSKPVVGLWSRTLVDRSVGGSIAAGIAGQLALALSGIVVARALGVQGRGDLAVVILVPSVVGQLGTLGVPLALTYRLARDPTAGRALAAALRRVAALQIILVTTAGTALLLALVHGERLAILAAIPVLPALVAQQFGLAVLQGEQRFSPFNVFRVAAPLLYACGAGALALAGRATLLGLVIVWMAANLGVGVILGWIALRYARPGVRDATGQSVRGVISFGSRALLGSSSPAEILRVDQAIIAVALPRAALGLYVVALAFTNLPRFISQSIGMVAYPRVSASGTRDDKTLVRHYLTVVGVTAGSVVVALEIAVPWLIPWLFGHAFRGAVVPAQILLLAALLLAMRRVLTDLAQGLGNPMAGTAAEAVNLSFSLPLIAAAAPLYGIRGAAAALTIGAAVSLTYLAHVVRRLLREGH